jgi:hypothetical protein
VLQDSHGRIRMCFAYSGECDHAPTVCVTGHWVALMFSIPYYTYHRCMCINILQR